MIRALLINLLLFLLPFMIYAAYVSVKTRSITSGLEWHEGRIAALTAMGMVLLLGGLAFWHQQDAKNTQVNPLLQFEDPPLETEDEDDKRPTFGGPF